MKNNNTTNEKLFSYGTLQEEKVQLSTFGRKLTGKSDILSGYKLLQLKISDPDVIITSGKEIHPMLVHTGNKNDTVAGVVFDVTLAEIEMADQYEVSDYTRVKETLISATVAWVYISIGNPLLFSTNNHNV